MQSMVEDAKLTKEVGVRVIARTERGFFCRGEIRLFAGEDLPIR